MPAIIAPTTHDAIVALLHEGIGNNEIARRLRCSRSLVGKLKAQYIARRADEQTSERYPWYDRAIDPDLVALPVLATTMDLDPTTVFYRCRTRGIPVQRVVGPPGAMPRVVRMIDGATPIQALLGDGRAKSTMENYRQLPSLPKKKKPTPAMRYLTDCPQCGKPMRNLPEARCTWCAYQDAR